MDDKYERLLTKAKIELMTRSAFISTISLSLRHKISDEIPTAGTNGREVVYNPKFLDKLSFSEIVGLMAHECWHVAYGHLSRLGSRNPQYWNIAGDYVINLMLNDQGYQLPKEGYLDERFRDMSTEKVYDIVSEEAPEPDEDLIDLINSDVTEEDIQNITDILVRASTQSKLSGKSRDEIPSEISRLIDDLINPKLNWKELLDRFLTATIKSEYSFRRPNRRFLPDVYLPSQLGNGLGHLTFAIDTSGSVNDEELTEMLSEIHSIRELMKPSEMTIIDCDSAIHHVHHVDENTDILDLEFTGGGGTSFQPVLDYIAQNPTQALVYFTDLYGEDSLNDVDYPILWICNSEHKPMNIGETIYIRS